MLEPGDKRRVYEYMRVHGHSRLTIKILMGYQPDGLDRMTVILGKATEYDYKLLDDIDYRLSELTHFLELAKNS
ncbi:MAG: hypothetical protein V1710_10035 [Candidatus Bathyarchaeota archaeon]